MLVKHEDKPTYSLRLAPYWEILGPFQIGTRGEHAMRSMTAMPEL